MPVQSALVSVAHTSGARVPVTSEIVVGKDVLELLSTAMYVDPLAILREYVQNAADAIDAAHEDGLLGKDVSGRIDVQINSESRELVVRDNGIGVPLADVERVLVSFGASYKRGKGFRGFRGIGRLGGLGYGRTLTFRTRAADDPYITEIEWDCRELREQLLAVASRLGLEDVVRRIVRVKRVSVRGGEPHFFEVRLGGVVRMWNDRLLNRAEVFKYLSQVCPLPFNPDLPFADKIENHLGKHVPPRRFRVYLNNEPSFLVRPYGRSFSVAAGKRDGFLDCELLEVPGLDGGPAAVGWILHHSYLGALRSAPEIRGLRARTGDIQVGDEEIFAGLFPEKRFNSWVVGEIHMLDHRLVPNGRRDNFEHNGAYASLLNYLSPICREIARKCRISSSRRSRLHAFDKNESQANDLLNDLRRGVPGEKSHRSALKMVDACILAMDRIARSSLFRESVRTDLHVRLKRLMARRRRSVTVPKRKRIELMIPARKRRMYQELARLVRACASSRQATSLLERIARRLTRQG